MTGPCGSVLVGANGAVGSTTWQSSGNTGVQSGWSRDDFYMELEPVPGPTTGDPTSSGREENRNYDHVLTTGTWRVSDLVGSVYVKGDAVLIVDNTLNLTGADQVVIPEGSSLKMWVNAKDAKVTSNAIQNQTGLPENFQYYGTAANTSLILGGSVNFNGVIYAPTADILAGGGGSAPINILGAMVGRSITMTGKINMHFDESLSRKLIKGFIINSWAEI